MARKNVPTRMSRYLTVGRSRTMRVEAIGDFDPRHDEATGHKAMQYRREDARYVAWRDTGANDDAIRIDTVSPLDPDALALLEAGWFDETALPALIRAAVQSRRLASEYASVASARVRDAGAAATATDRRRALRLAQRARRDAETCETFATMCESRGNELALVYGFSPVTRAFPFAALTTDSGASPEPRRELVNG